MFLAEIPSHGCVCMLPVSLICLSVCHCASVDRFTCTRGLYRAAPASFAVYTSRRRIICNYLEQLLRKSFESTGGNPQLLRFSLAESVFHKARVCVCLSAFYPRSLSLPAFQFRRTRLCDIFVRHLEHTGHHRISS